MFGNIFSPYNIFNTKQIHNATRIAKAITQLRNIRIIDGLEKPQLIQIGALKELGCLQTGQGYKLKNIGVFLSGFEG
jgi:hypothetical protein